MTQQVQPQPIQQYPQQTAPSPQPQPGPDRQLQQEKTLYSSSYTSIFFRNFIAGAARSLGGIILYLVFMFFAGYLFTTYILPELQPVLDSFDTINQLGELQTSQPSLQGQPQISPEQIDQVLQQLKSQ